MFSLNRLRYGSTKWMKQFKLIPFMRSKSIFRTMKSVAITSSISVGQPVLCAQSAVVTDTMP